MNRETKELDLALSNVKFEVGGAGLQFLSPITRKEILDICRETGLMFVVPRETQFFIDKPYTLKEIDIE